MQKSQLPFEVFETIVETASLWLVPAEESSGEDPDSVRLRKSYSGRGYASGFAIVVESASALYRFLAAAGIVYADLQEQDQPDFDLDDFARCTATDAMGRSGTVVYWHNWEITDVPDEMTRD